MRAGFGGGGDGGGDSIGGDSIVVDEDFLGNIQTLII